MKIILISGEVAPYAKTGGLADVLGALPEALARRGHDVTVFLPFYRCVNAPEDELLLSETLPFFDHQAAYSVHRIAHRSGAHFYAIRKDEYFDRSFLYGTPERDYEDNAKRFIFFCRAVVHAIRELGLAADIIHAHDWQAGLVPALWKALWREGRAPAIPLVFTIHNLAYQGIFNAREFDRTGLPADFFTPEGVEFYGHLNLLKAGIVHADAVTTVSRRYAEEIQTPEYGCGLEGVLLARREALHGIVNGVDSSVWNPETDAHLPKRYGPSALRGKSACKQALLAELGISFLPKAPLLAVVTRFARQKGLEILCAAAGEILERGFNLAILGSGDAAYEKALQDIASRHPGRVGLRIAFEEGIAHRVYAGSDFLAMPSLYEPCGLSQMYAMRYGSIPVVRATGGLDDTVQAWDAETRRGTGFKFEAPEPAAFLEALDDALAAYRRPAHFGALRRNAMAADFSWDHSAEQYENLYHSLNPHA